MHDPCVYFELDSLRGMLVAATAKYEALLVALSAGCVTQRTDGGFDVTGTGALRPRLWDSVAVLAFMKDIGMWREAVEGDEAKERAALCTSFLTDRPSPSMESQEREKVKAVRAAARTAADPAVDYADGYVYRARKKGKCKTKKAKKNAEQQVVRKRKVAAMGRRHEVREKAWVRLGQDVHPAGLDVVEVLEKPKKPTEQESVPAEPQEKSPAPVSPSTQGLSDDVADCSVYSCSEVTASPVQSPRAVVWPDADIPHVNDPPVTHFYHVKGLSKRAVKRFHRTTSKKTVENAPRKKLMSKARAWAFAFKYDGLW